MQVTITDRNAWEGESFSFVMELDPETAWQIKKDAVSPLKVELDTTYTQKEIDLINDSSHNGYMDRIGFYEFREDFKTFERDIYMDLFYKGVGLINLKRK